MNGRNPRIEGSREVSQGFLIIESGFASVAYKDAAKAKRRPSKLFIVYAVQLGFRLLLFAVALLLLIFAPHALLISEGLDLGSGFSFVLLVFIVLVIDMLLKLIPNVRIAQGSLKQFRRFHVPTKTLLENGPEAIPAFVRELIQQGRITLEQVPYQLQTAWEETRTGAVDSLKTLIESFDFLKIIPFKDEQLTAKQSLRSRIRRDRWREIIPVIIFWVVANTALSVVLYLFGLLTQQAIVIWVLFYFVFDMISVVLWCPLQLWFMKNRCCTTCQIFNWDGIMAVTPLFLLITDLSTAWFVWPLLLLSLVVLLRWELAFARHPERFDERTNASLSCQHCPDKLCFVRDPLAAHLTDLKSLGDTGKKHHRAS